MIEVKETMADWVLERFEVPKLVADRSFGIWQVWDQDALVLVCGVVRETMLGHTKLWVVLVEGRRSTLRALRELTAEVKRRFDPVIAFAKPGRDVRFAEFAGFRQAGEEGDLVRLEL